MRSLETLLAVLENAPSTLVSVEELDLLATVGAHPKKDFENFTFGKSTISALYPDVDVSKVNCSFLMSLGRHAKNPLATTENTLAFLEWLSQQTKGWAENYSPTSKACLNGFRHMTEGWTFTGFSGPAKSGGKRTTTFDATKFKRQTPPATVAAIVEKVTRAESESVDFRSLLQIVSR